MTSDSAILPEQPFLTHDDSMLTRKFGKEVINYYAGGRLNRISFLRSDAKFLQKAATSPASRYLALQKLNPLAKDKSQPALLKFEDVTPLIGSEPYKLSEDEFISEFDSTVSQPILVFLGLLEDDEADDFPTTDHGVVRGQPFFAVDITPTASNGQVAESLLEKWRSDGYEIESNPRALSFRAEVAAIYAQARSMVDWNDRNKFCAGCGSRNLSVYAGYKRVCPPTDKKSGSPEPRDDCPTRHGVSNVCFPRTDPTMIAAVVSADGQRVLLGRQSRWPKDWFSALAGFLEPGESIEESVRREVWEESGVRVGRVVIHSSQPWPYPSSLMIGAIAQALPGHEDVTLNDKELESARWFTIDEVREALKTGTSGLGEAAPTGYVEGNLRLPPPQAIANRLINAVAEGFLAGAAKI